MHQIDALGFRVPLFDEIAQTFGVVALGAVLRHRHMAPARKWLDHHKEVSGAMPLVLIVSPLRVPLCCRVPWSVGPVRDRAC